MRPVTYAIFEPEYLNNGANGPDNNGPIDVHSTYTTPFWCEDCYGYDGFHVSEFRAWPIRCPSCRDCFAEAHGDDDDRVLVALMAELRYVRVRAAERDGVPAYGPRRGAFLRGRDPMHHGIHRTRRVLRARGGSDDDPQHVDDYTLGARIMHVFDTWCPNCRRRLRVDTARRHAKIAANSP